MHADVCSSQHGINKAIVEHVHTNNTWGVEAGESTCDNPWLRGMLKASLVIMIIITTTIIIKFQGVVSHPTNPQLCAEELGKSQRRFHQGSYMIRF